VENFVRSDPVFAALVFPAAVRQILAHVLLALQESDPGGDGWPSLWLRFAATYHPEPPPEPGDADVQECLDWVGDVVRAFCERPRLQDGLRAAGGEGRS